MICGVDEAGKGPVIGPMVVAAVLIDNAKQIEGAGFKDSKLLTIQKRRELFDLINSSHNHQTHQHQNHHSHGSMGLGLL